MKYRFDYRRYRLPFRAIARTAHGPWAEREGVLVRLQSEAGNSGYGEAAVIPWFGTETVDAAEAVCRELGRIVDAAQLAALPPKMTCLRNACVAAQHAFGGEPALGTNAHLGVAALLPAGRKGLAALPSLADAGFRVFKWKVGVGDVADELGLLDDVCAALPSGAKLRLDANGAWDRRQAERWLERGADRPIEFIEQPVAPETRGATDLLLGLAHDYPTPVALDESLTGADDIERWIGVGWPGVYVVKPSLFGDAGGVLVQLASAKADVVFSSALETAVGARAALQLAFAWTGPPRALGFGVGPLFADPRFDGPHLAPFIRVEDVARIDGEAVWNALS